MLRRSLACVAPALVAFASCTVDDEDPGTWAALPVRSVVVAGRDFRPEVVLAGIMRPSSSIAITVPAEGIIAFAPRFAAGLRDGETVAAGELLAVIDNEPARHGVAQARLALDAARLEQERTARAAQLGVVSQVEREQTELRYRQAQESLETAERQATTMRLVAPGAGVLVVTGTPPSAGARVAAGVVLGEVHPAGAPLRIEAHVAAAERARLAPGQSMVVRRPGEESGVPGTVAEVGRVVEDAGTVRVMGDLREDGGSWAPGEGVELVVGTGERTGAITVPDEALVVGDSGYAVFTLRPAAIYAGRFVATRVPVELGGRAAGQVELLRGVKDGERVVVSGTSFLDDGALVTDAAVRKAEKAASDRR